MPARAWCAPLLGHLASRLRGDVLFPLADGGPEMLVAYLGAEVGLQLPSGRVLVITRLPRFIFGGGPPLPPRAVHPHDFVYGTRGSPASLLTLEDMVGFLSLMPDGLATAAMLWNGHCMGPRFNPDVAAFLEEQSLKLRQINMRKYRAVRALQNPADELSRKAARTGPP